MKVINKLYQYLSNDDKKLADHFILNTNFYDLALFLMEQSVIIHK